MNGRCCGWILTNVSLALVVSPLPCRCWRSPHVLPSTGLAIRTIGRRIPIASFQTSSTNAEFDSGSNINSNVNSNLITDWVVENLESDFHSSNETQSITSRSAVKAGENDVLPSHGLIIGRVRILAADSAPEFNPQHQDVSNSVRDIRLLLGRNGWGTGVHPTTRLCIEWICSTVQGGETVLDYGCGSGVLSIAALHMGAAKCVGVDVEAESLVTAVRNVELNGYDSTTNRERFEAFHTREVLPYGISETGVDICVANILVGQLVRPSMVAALVTNLAPGGLLCLSGIRPGEQVEALKEAYGTASIEWVDYEELSASETAHSIESYGFDCGDWCRLVGRKMLSSRHDDILSMSELAIS